MGKRLLLADDSVTIQKVVEITFADKDYELVLTGTGDEALQAAQSKRPDLILADVFMPGMDGYQLCERIKKDAGLAGVPVLLLAGTFEPFDEERAGQVGAAGWVSKPFTSQTLVEKVEQTLAQVEELAQPWNIEPSKSAADSMRNAFEQLASTDFAASRSDKFSMDSGQTVADESQKTQKAPEPEEQTTADFATGTKKDFTFDDLTDDAPVNKAIPRTQTFETFSEDSTFEPAPLAPEVSESAAFPEAPSADFSFTSDEAGNQTGYSEVEKNGDGSLPGTSSPEPAGDAVDATEAGAPFSSHVISSEDSLEPELPSLDDFTASESATGEVASPPAEAKRVLPSHVSSASAAEGIIDLREEDIVAEGTYAATPERVEARAAYLSDAELERIVERVASSVIERLAIPVMEKVVWEVVPDLAENMIREEMDKIKDSAVTGN